MERAVKERDLVQQGLARDVLEQGRAFSRPVALNVIPKCGSIQDGGFTSEELKLCHETRRILSLPELPVTATCVRVPVIVGHGVSVHAEFDRPLSAEDARRALEAAPGVEVWDDPANDLFPSPLDAAGRDPCHVGRIRSDPFDDHAIEMFCVADNLRKGAALNTVQIAELLVGGPP
jgi:aspartate-semialdehyde dehydrogenase